MPLISWRELRHVRPLHPLSVVGESLPILGLLLPPGAAGLALENGPHHAALRPESLKLVSVHVFFLVCWFWRGLGKVLRVL